MFYILKNTVNYCYFVFKTVEITSFRVIPGNSIFTSILFREDFDNFENEVNNSFNKSIILAYYEHKQHVLNITTST